ncbi:MAG: glycosyltransferase [Bacteroidota bacterium]|nr:glycosyltransferase [Bacteroidota bacterium]
MHNQQRQIFQTSKSTRWKSFLWIVRVFAFFMIFCLVALIISLNQKQVIRIPEIRERASMYRRLTDQDVQQSLKSPEKELFKKTLREVRRKRRPDFYKKNAARIHTGSFHFPVRAAFYVNWDVQSMYSLENNIQNVNMVLPEWFFVKDGEGNLETRIDTAALNVMRIEDVKVIPMLSNFVNKEWNGKNVHKVISSPLKRRKLINNILATLKAYKLDGINVDFEELKEKSDENFIRFQKELFVALHSRGYFVSQDISPFNNDYNPKALSRYNDLIFLMAYDQHNDSDSPGPVAAQKWVEAALDEISNKIPPEKVVLCVATFGYDWATHARGTNVTYQEAISTALESDGKIQYDEDSFNLHYTYWDDNDVSHKVYFTDAATAFNAIRAAEDFGTAGVAIWRLGSEDPRIWSFYKQDLSYEAILKHPFHYGILENISSTSSVDYIGAGEVLDVITSPAAGKLKIQSNREDQLISTEKYITLPTSFVIKRSGKHNKEVAITFDDGPDEDYTPRLLDILKQYKVPACFFITGVNAENHLPIVKRMYEEGHEIGNHTLLHPNLEKISDNRIRLELRSTGRIIEGITGHATIMFRTPYNTDNQPTNPVTIHPIAVAKSENYLTIGSAIDAEDWQPGITVDSIMANVRRDQHLGNIILLHDAGGKREATVAALPRIIEYFQSMGYKFVPVSQLIGRTRDEVMPSSETMNSNFYLKQADYTFFQIGYLFDYFLYTLFFLALFLTFFKIVSIAILAIIQHRKNKKLNKLELKDHPKVSIIVPAYNEEVTASKTISNLLKTNYSDYEVIFIDDGSSDKTYEIVSKQFANVENVKVLTKPNGGKATALNYGIEHASGEFLVCIDADTVLHPDAIRLLLSRFIDDRTAAVAGNVRVGNKLNLMTRWQSIEYTTSQNFDRMAFDVLNIIMVVPGAIGAFRKSAVLEVGSMKTDTLAEDCDLTLRLLRAGYKVHSCNDALAFTEAPETLSMFLKQRFRWSFGIMQSFWKHRELIFTRKRPNLGWLLLPHLLIFQLFLPLFNPIVDLMMLVSLFSPNALKVTGFYFAYFLIDLLIAFLAFRMDHQKFTARTIWDMFIQRIVYRQFLFFVLIKSYLRAIKGELAGWGVIKRTGNVDA